MGNAGISHTSRAHGPRATFPLPTYPQPRQAGLVIKAYKSCLYTATTTYFVALDIKVVDIPTLGTLRVLT
jgi:hypothetical protein